MLRILPAILLVGVLPVSVMGQPKKIPKEPLQVVDADSGKLIPELLLLPRFFSFTGISTLLGEGPGRGTYRYYLAKPLVYRTGDPFVLKPPKSNGFNLPGLLFIGKGRTVYGVLLIAPGYRPQWFTSLWSIGSERKLRLTPISDNDWSLLLEKKLSRLEKDVTRIEEDCPFWSVPSPCSLEIHYNKKERELVRSFLRQSKTK